MPEKNKARASTAPRVSRVKRIVSREKQEPAVSPTVVREGNVEYLVTTTVTTEVVTYETTVTSKKIIKKHWESKGLQVSEKKYPVMLSPTERALALEKARDKHPDVLARVDRGLGQLGCDRHLELLLFCILFLDYDATEGVLRIHGRASGSAQVSLFYLPERARLEPDRATERTTERAKGKLAKKSVRIQRAALCYLLAKGVLPKAVYFWDGDSNNIKLDNLSVERLGR